MNRQVKILLVGILIFLQLSFSQTKESWREHALYLGTIQVKYEGDSAVAHLELKVFSDDLQSAIRNAYETFKPGPISDLFTENQPLIETYFGEHLQVEINGSIQVLQLTHHEQLNDAHLLKFELKSPSVWNQLELTADFFMELFPTQTNVVSVSYLQQKQFARLSKQQPHCTAQFAP